MCRCGILNVTFSVREVKIKSANAYNDRPISTVLNISSLLLKTQSTFTITKSKTVVESRKKRGTIKFGRTTK